MSKWIPGPHEIVREGIIVLGGVLLSALILSRLPAVKAWVQRQGTIVVKDQNGNTLF